MPPLPIPASSARFGQLASILPDCASTQDIVRATAQIGAPEGFLALTDFQSGGRGRRGRSWQAPPGQALLFSLLLRPTRPIEELPSLSLVAAIAIAEALAGFGVEARLQWPNDVVISGAKVAGILLELETPEAGPVVFLGCGINVNVPSASLPETDRLPATSLLIETGAPVDRLELLERVLDRLQAAYRESQELGFRALFDRYAALDALQGRELTLELGDREVTGRCRGVDASGRLVIATSADEATAFESGEVVRVRD